MRILSGHWKLSVIGRCPYQRWVHTEMFDGIFNMRILILLTVKHFYCNHVCFTSTDSFNSFLPRLQRELLG